MREIKFRFYYGLDGKPETYFHRDFDFGEIEQGAHRDCISDSPLLRGYSIIGKAQYTGIKDRNGVEVYEGDILAGETFGQRVVGYDMHSFTCLEALRIYGEDASVVIGNIYENPEMTGVVIK